MIFEPNHLYHIYNQGNNRQKIFFSERNYLFFKEKIREYLLPYTNILGWVLMPNHFHLMVEVARVGATPSHPDTKTTPTPTLNHSIGIMLRSYTRAINKQEQRSGALFREETKAKCLSSPGAITPSWYKESGITIINTIPIEDQYPQVCLNYIHRNPLKAGLSGTIADWPYSSYHEYIGNIEDGLINKKSVAYWGLKVQG